MAVQNSVPAQGPRARLLQTRQALAAHHKTIAGVILTLVFVFVLDQMYYRATARDPMLVTAERYVQAMLAGDVSLLDGLILVPPDSTIQKEEAKAKALLDQHKLIYNTMNCAKVVAVPWQTTNLNYTDGVLHDYSTASVECLDNVGTNQFYIYVDLGTTSDGRVLVVPGFEAQQLSLQPGSGALNQIISNNNGMLLGEYQLGGDKALVVNYNDQLLIGIPFSYKVENRIWRAYSFQLKVAPFSTISGIDAASSLPGKYRIDFLPSRLAWPEQTAYPVIGEANTSTPVAPDKFTGKIWFPVTAAELTVPIQLLFYVESSDHTTDLTLIPVNVTPDQSAVYFQDVKEGRVGLDQPDHFLMVNAVKASDDGKSLTFNLSLDTSHLLHGDSLNLSCGSFLLKSGQDGQSWLLPTCNIVGQQFTTDNRDDLQAANPKPADRQQFDASFAVNPTVRYTLVYRFQVAGDQTIKECPLSPRNNCG